MKPEPDRWEVIQVSLEEPLGHLPALENATGAYIIFWYKDVPLGHARISASDFPLSKTDFEHRVSRAIALVVGNYLLENGFRAPLPALRQPPDFDIAPSLKSLTAFARPLESLATKALLPEGQETRVSVVVCTRNRPEQLKRCLTALRQLDPAPAEIIVVDNAPEDRSSRHVVEAFDGITYLQEPFSGLSLARNRGILSACAEIVAFTDDDVVVHPRWLVGIRHALSQRNVFGMTGLVLPAELESTAQIQFEFGFGGFNRGYRPITFDSFFFHSMLSRGVPVWRIGAGANMAFRREVFNRIGLFDERLGAGASGCSEDSELWYRMLAAGMSIAYEPRAVVWHAHRVDQGALLSQMRHYMRGHVAALLVQFEKHRHFGNLRRLFITLPDYYWQRLRRMPSHGNWSVFRAELAGCGSGLIAYVQRSLPADFTFTRQVDAAAAVYCGRASMHKRRLSDFLRANPYPNPFTEGLFYREKMRAIHRIAPDAPAKRILEVGGGRSGLTSLLYPDAEIVNLDINGEYASAPCNQRPRVRFVCGAATNLPFEAESFDAVTMFDLLEHVVDDRKAILEAFRVLRPGGFLLVSTPNENWRYPYYGFIRKFCPPEEKLFAQWGHVRRGYSRAEIENLVGYPAARAASFINPLTVLCHDVGFSNLTGRKKQVCWALLSPITIAGYVLHDAAGTGTETAYGWIKPNLIRQSAQGRTPPLAPIQAAL